MTVAVKISWKINASNIWWNVNGMAGVLMTSCFIQASGPKSSMTLYFEEFRQVVVSDNYSIWLSLSEFGSEGKVWYLWLTLYWRGAVVGVQRNEAVYELHGPCGEEDL